MALKESLSLVQLVQAPTHCCTNGPDSLIDLVLVSNVNHVSTCSVVPPLANSDHNGIGVTLRWNPAVKPRRNVQRVVWRYDLADVEKACALINETDWSSLLDPADVNHSVQNWSHRFLSIIQEAIPQ